ncbi:hypothetical protein QTI51_24690 [Variovorax sp. J22G73]|uniref:hypothetical protein n=1 Tax=unclassified Variovorax TaxID=663243 RepID=UPI0025769022|nr:MULTISPECIES: hypothetical protein [unclassified Variovorax]MDM0007879.1 hypothetical protein [Variovorax sp. J22R203]MDM0100498.1 hypothetical protein [Variovorax sp. J22G73]
MASATAAAREPVALSVAKLDAALCVISQARDVAEAMATCEGVDAFWGVLRLVECGVDKVEAAFASRSRDASDEASDELAGVLGVLGEINLDHILLHALVTLVALAKSNLDTSALGK